MCRALHKAVCKIDRQTDIHKDRQTENYRDRVTISLTDGLTSSQTMTGWFSGKERQRLIDRQTEMDRQTDMLLCCVRLFTRLSVQDIQTSMQTYMYSKADRLCRQSDNHTDRQADWLSEKDDSLDRDKQTGVNRQTHMQQAVWIDKQW